MLKESTFSTAWYVYNLVAHFRISSAFHRIPIFYKENDTYPIYS